MAAITKHRYCIYARVSPKGSTWAAQETSIKAQLHDCREYILRTDPEAVFTEIYDEFRSGSWSATTLATMMRWGKCAAAKKLPTAPNPFVAPSEWKRFLTIRAELVRQLMTEDPVERNVQLSRFHKDQY